MPFPNENKPRYLGCYRSRSFLRVSLRSINAPVAQHLNGLKRPSHEIVKIHSGQTVAK